MIDIIYLTHNRIEFTKASLKALFDNTDWSKVGKLILYDDDSIDGTQEYLKSLQYPVNAEFLFSSFGGPVAVMNNYLKRKPAEIFAKIDNDTMVPPKWLSECLKVMRVNTMLDLLGIEAFNRIEPGELYRTFRIAVHIGGIGLMRSKCFRTLPHPNGTGGRFGFTKWQQDNTGVVKGWIDPSIPVFLLDRIPMDPWQTLSQAYVAKGWSRRWPPYDEKQNAMWSWWK